MITALSPTASNGRDGNGKSPDRCGHHKRRAFLRAYAETYNIKLADQAAGIHRQRYPQIAQHIMRHADYRTTLKYYTVLGLADTSKAISQLPSIQGPQRTLAAGTDEGPTDPQQSEHETVQDGVIQCDEYSGASPTANAHKPLRTVEKCEPTRPGATACAKAGEGTRTLNIQLGRLTLYQLSYARSFTAHRSIGVLRFARGHNLR